MGKVIAVTGAAGYLGQTLVAYLEKQPWVERIICLDVKPLPSTERAISYCMDVRDFSLLRAIFSEHAVTHLVHAAFIVTPPPGLTEQQMYAANVEGSQSVFQNAIGYGIEHILFISSVAVYGYRSGRSLAVREDAPQAPTMLYGEHKAQVERNLKQLADNFPRVRIAVVRPTAVVGPLGRMLSPLRALTAHPIFVLSNGGKALTQALHEQDAAALLAAVVERGLAGVFNAAPNDFASWADIARLSRLPTVSLPRSLLNFATRFNTVWPALRGFTRDVVDLFSESLVVDNTLVRQVTGWMPRHTTREAFAQLFGAEARELSSVRGLTG